MSPAVARQFGPEGCSPGRPRRTHALASVDALSVVLMLPAAEYFAPRSHPCSDNCTEKTDRSLPPARFWQQYYENELAAFRPASLFLASVQEARELL